MIQVYSIGNGAANVVDKLRNEHTYSGVSFYYDYAETDISPSSTVIFVCCLGGRTSYSQALDMLKAVTSNGSRVLALFTIPASVEGANRRSKAIDDFAVLAQYCSVAVLLDNGKLPQSLFFSDTDDAMCELLSILLNGSALHGSSQSTFADTATSQQIYNKLVLRYCSAMPPYFEAGSFSFYSRVTGHLCS